MPRVRPESLVLRAEGCSPGNQEVDPGETVTIALRLANIGPVAAQDLIATLLPGEQVLPITDSRGYGALPPGGSSAQEFQFVASGACGGIVRVRFHLQDGATDLGVVEQAFRLGRVDGTESLVFTGEGLPDPLPDMTTTNSSILVTDDRPVRDVNVHVRIGHPRVSDLTIDLVAPNGITVRLANGAGGDGADYGTGAEDCSGTMTSFDDAAPVAISDATAPLAGAYRPAQSLSAFNGLLANGRWHLRVRDNGWDMPGTLFCWRLEIGTDRYACCSSGSSRLELARRILRIAGGGNATTAEEVQRVDGETSGTSAGRLDIVDAIRVLR